MIFLDMDGVLCDFVTHAMQLHGREYNEDQWPKGVYEMRDAIGIDDADFWAPINVAGADWWANLPPYSWAEDLIKLCELLGEVGIATSPNRDGASAAGKTSWMWRHCPRLARKMMIGPCKEWLAHSGAILIDDSDEKCQKFEAKGGIAIVFPQPWNSKHDMTLNRLDYIGEQLGITRTETNA